jgi:hypothetical protein
MSLNKNTAQYQSILLKVLIFGLITFHLVPLLISAFYSQPTSVDDYCYADTVQKFGMVEAIRMYYTQVTGRYLSTLLQHVLNPLSYGSQFNEGFKILPIVFLIALVGAVRMVLKQVFVSKPFITVAALVFVTTFTSQMPSIAEGLYWFASVVVHWLGFVLFFVNCAYLLQLSFQKKASKSSLVLATISILLAAGASEPAFLSFVIVCFAVIVFQLFKFRKVNKKVLWLTGVGLVGVALIKFSSSNMGKQNVALSDLDFNLLLQVLVEIGSYTKSFVSWYLGSILVLYLVFFGNDVRENKLFNLPVWYVALTSIGVVYFNHFIGVVGVGGSAPRVWNGIYLYFLAGLFSTVSVLWHKYGTELKTTTFFKIGLATIALVASLKTNTLFTYKDVRHGTFTKYTHEIEQRISALESEKDGIELPLIEYKPYSLFFYDMNVNPYGQWTKCLGDYYGKQQVTFKEN